MTVSDYRTAIREIYDSLKSYKATAYLSSDKNSYIIRSHIFCFDKVEIMFGVHPNLHDMSVLFLVGSNSIKLPCSDPYLKYDVISTDIADKLEMLDSRTDYRDLTFEDIQMCKAIYNEFKVYIK